MAENVVSILVKASDATADGFTSAEGRAAASAERISAAQDKVTAAETKLRDAQIAQGDAQLKLEELQQSGTASADEMAAAQDKVAAASMRAVDAQIALGRADLALADAQRVVADTADKQARNITWDKAAASAGAAVAKFAVVGGAALAAIGYESVKLAMSFQASMERIVTQAGVPQAELGQLKAGVLNLAGAVGFSPDSLAVSLYHVASNFASLGISAPKMLDAVKIAAEGARVGGANLEDVTNALTAAIASGIPGVQNFSDAMGALNAIVGAGDMTMQNLAEAMGTGVMAVVKGYGLSLKDVGAALATFGDNNIRGAHAATALRMAVQSLAVPAASGKALLDSMGLSMTSLADTMRNQGLLAALEELQAHFVAAGITAKEQGDVITQIFGKKAGVGLAVLMDQMDRLKSKYGDIAKGAKGFGDAWDNTQNTLQQQLANLRGNFDALGTSIGLALIPPLTKFLQFLNGTVMPQVASALKPVENFWNLLTGKGSAPSPSSSGYPLGILPPLKSKLDPYTYFFKQDPYTTPLKEPPPPKSKLDPYAYFFQQNQVAPPDPYGVFFKEEHPDPAPAKRTVSTIIDQIMAQLGKESGKITGALIKMFAQIDWESLGKQVVMMAVPFIVGFGVNLGNAIIAEATHHPMDLLLFVLTLIPVGRIGGIIGKVFEDIPIVGPLVKALTKPLELAGGAVEKLVGGLFKLIFGKSFDDLLVSPAKNLVQGLIDGFKSKWGDAEKLVAGVPFKILRFFVEWPLKLLWKVGSDLVSGLLDGLESKFPTLTAWIKGIPKMILGVFADAGSWLIQAGKNIITGLLRGGESMLGGAITTVKGWGHDLLNALGSPFGIHFSEPSEATQVIKAGQNIAMGLGAGMLSGRSAVAAAAHQLAGAAGISPGAGYGAGAGAGGVSIEFNISGGGVLPPEFWRQFQNGVRAKGGDPRIVTSKVKFA